MLKVSKISFGNNKNIQLESDKTIGQSKPDFFEVNNKIKPPELTTLQILFDTFTDEQIEQINKAKMLPENARFVFNNTLWARGHKYDPPHYLIRLYIPNVTKEIGTRILPEGYEVKRIPLEGVKVVKKKNNL